MCDLPKKHVGSTSSLKRRLGRCRSDNDLLKKQKRLSDRSEAPHNVSRHESVPRLLTLPLIIFHVGTTSGRPRQCRGDSTLLYI